MEHRWQAEPSREVETETGDLDDLVIDNPKDIESNELELRGIRRAVIGRGGGLTICPRGDEPEAAPKGKDHFVEGADHVTTIEPESGRRHELFRVAAQGLHQPICVATLEGVDEALKRGPLLRRSPVGPPI